MDNQLSYKFIQNSIRNFRHLRGDDFNWYDEPGTYWFKPIFYFYKSTTEKDNTIDVNNEGLLHPSWLTNNATGDIRASEDPAGTVSATMRKRALETRFVSSAYNYLMRNDEQKRANLLKQFITLLSNIASRSPWYFQEVGGLDSALDNSEAFKDGKFVTDTRKQITFTLLPDAVDNRIGTLIDLYRSVCYSWKDKKEIVPSNLRKFDMGIYIFGSMIQDRNSNSLFSKAALQGALSTAGQLGVDYVPDTSIVDATGKYEYDNSLKKNRSVSTTQTTVDGRTVTVIDTSGTNSVPSTRTVGSAHMFIEFHNCEIDLSSTKGGDTISNADGSERKYTLTINYDDCYVNRYNDFIVGAIGDILRTDIDDALYGASIDAGLGRANVPSREYDNQLGKSLSKVSLEDRLRSLGISTDAINPVKMVSNTVGSLVGATVGRGIQELRNTIGGALLGNLYGTSPLSTYYDVVSGRMVSKALVENERTERNTPTTSEKTLYPPVSKSLDTIKPDTYMYERIETNKIKIQQLGNLYRGQGLLSSI